MQLNQSDTLQPIRHETERLISHPRGSLSFKISFTEQELRLAVFLANGLNVTLLLGGLLSILAAQHVYETSVGADDDLIAEAIEGFHHRRISLWFVPAQLLCVSCAIVGILESRSISTTTEEFKRSIVMIGIAAASFAFDFGLSISFLRVTKAVVSFSCLLPHLFLLELMHKRHITLVDSHHDRYHQQEQIV